MQINSFFIVFIFLGLLFSAKPTTTGKFLSQDHSKSQKTSKLKASQIISFNNFFKFSIFCRFSDFLKKDPVKSIETYEVHNDELFSNSKYEPDVLQKEENEAKPHAFEFNEEENEEMHMMERDRHEKLDYKDFEK